VAASTPLIVSIDIGTSSVRTLLFDSEGRQQAGFGDHVSYQVTTTPDGGVEIDPAALLDMTVHCLASLHDQVQKAGLKPAAVGISAFWHSFLGVDKAGSPTTSIIHLFDTRSAAEAEELRRELDAKAVHARTGCRLHTSYWPAKLLWLHRNRADQFGKTDRWMSFGEYLFLQLFGSAMASTSMVSGSGLWDQTANAYDEEVLKALPIQTRQLCGPDDMDKPQTKLADSYRRKWPLFDGIPWFPAAGDGACDNIGSGCTTPDTFALMVGTSGAMRAILEQDQIQIPDGLWCYRVDRKRFILGGALSNGGNVYAWMRRTLALPSEAESEAALEKSTPGSHGLELLPFFAGERSPYWRADLRAAITGMNLSTRAIDILQAGLESVSLRFREIFTLMTGSLGEPRHVIESGGGLLKSRAWSQMMADALGVPVLPCLENEASGRGAALLAAERIGAILDITKVPVALGPPIQFKAENTKLYAAMLAAQKTLYEKLFAGNS
jgi:gluconokinase